MPVIRIDTSPPSFNFADRLAPSANGLLQFGTALMQAPLQRRLLEQEREGQLFQQAAKTRGLDLQERRLDLMQRKAGETKPAGPQAGELVPSSILNFVTSQPQEVIVRDANGFPVLDEQGEPVREMRRIPLAPDLAAQRIRELGADPQTFRFTPTPLGQLTPGPFQDVQPSPAATAAPGVEPGPSAPAPADAVAPAAQPEPALMPGPPPTEASTPTTRLGGYEVTPEGTVDFGEHGVLPVRPAPVGGQLELPSGERFAHQLDPVAQASDLPISLAYDLPESTGLLTGTMELLHGRDEAARRIQSGQVSLEDQLAMVLVEQLEGASIAGRTDAQVHRSVSSGNEAQRAAQRAQVMDWLERWTTPDPQVMARQVRLMGPATKRAVRWYWENRQRLERQQAAGGQ